MIRRATLLLLLALALPAGAAWHPVVSHRDIVVEVGSIDSSLVVTAWWSGFSMPEQINWRFRSSDDSIAVVDDGWVTRSSGTEIRVLGVAPGVAWITGSSAPDVKVTVICGTDPLVAPRKAVVIAQPGVFVDLAAVTPIALRTTFSWYYGRVGDKSAPVATGPAEISVKTGDAREYYWVEASTPCSTSSAEFRVEPERPRRRSAR